VKQPAYSTAETNCTVTTFSKNIYVSNISESVTHMVFTFLATRKVRPSPLNLYLMQTFEMIKDLLTPSLTKQTQNTSK
jgi:acyl-CoA hydrolase